MERTALCSVVLLSLFSLGLCTKCNFTEPCQFTFNDTNSQNKSVVCTRIVTNAEIEVKYFNSSMPNQTLTTTVCLPCKDVKVNGTCNTNTSDKNVNGSALLLSWDNRTDNSYSYNLLFIFTENLKKGSQHWTMNNITLHVMTKYNYSNSTANFTANATSDFVGEIDYTRSYKCKSSQTLKLVTYNSTKFNATLTLANLRVQSFQFNNATSGDFGNAAKCTMDANASKIVPIAVGAALGGLIIVVLVAYVIGRLRSRRQTAYEPLS